MSSYFKQDTYPHYYAPNIPESIPRQPEIIYIPKGCGVTLKKGTYLSMCGCAFVDIKKLGVAPTKFLAALVDCLDVSDTYTSCTRETVYSVKNGNPLPDDTNVPEVWAALGFIELLNDNLDLGHFLYDQFGINRRYHRILMNYLHTKDYVFHGGSLLGPHTYETCDEKYKQMIFNWKPSSNFNETWESESESESEGD